MTTSLDFNCQPLGYALHFQVTMWPRLLSGGSSLPKKVLIAKCTQQIGALLTWSLRANSTTSFWYCHAKIPYLQGYEVD